MLVFVILIQIEAYSQSEKKLEKQYDRALVLLYDEQFDIARIEFEEIALVDPDYKDVPYRLELTYFLDGESNRSLDKLLSFEKTIARKDKFYHYWLGRVFVTKYMFGEAIGSWNNFLSRDGFKSKEIRQETNEFIQSTETLSAFFEDNTDYVVTLLPETINTAEAELNPAFSSDNQQLLYSTSAISRDKKEIFEIRGARLVQMGDESEWEAPKRIPALNAVEENNTRFCLTYWENWVETLIAKNNGELYTSTLVNESWQEPREANYEIKIPALGPDFTTNRKQNRIIYSSDKRLKKNGLDLFEIRYDSVLEQWTKPTPILAVNSLKDESSPYLTFDEQTLYFSSNGHNAIGGFDIFYSKWDKQKGTWGSPIQMNYPINTPDDEIHFKLAKDGAGGYFSSNRVFSRGDFDIFNFTKVPKSKVSGKVLYASSNEPVPDVQIIFLPRQYVSERYATFSDTDGSFEMKLLDEETYVVQIKRGNQLEAQDELQINGEESQELNFLISEDSTEGIQLIPVAKKMASVQKPQGAESSLNNKPSRTKRTYTAAEKIKRLRKGYKLVRENIYFDPGGINESHDPDPILYKAVRLLGIRKELMVEVAGHSDNTGSASFNEKVSLERAQKVKAWLINLGISPDRIRAVGYGANRPLSTNDDEKDGRELNRRVEIRIVSTAL